MNVKQSEDPRLQSFKSSYSGGEGSDCVEVARTPPPCTSGIKGHRAVGHCCHAVWSAFLNPALRN